MLFLVLSIVSALKLPIHASRQPVKLKTTGSNPIELGNYFNELYYFNLKVGSYNSELSVMIDTGSKYLWIPNINCETCEHADNFYNSSASSTSKSLFLEYTFKYGQGSVTGTATEDSIKISGDNKTELENFPFLSVSKATNFDDFNSDGILGLSFGDKTFGFKNFVEELKSQGEIEVASFSLYLNYNLLDEFISTNPTSTIIFGGFDMALAQENFKYLKIDKSSGYWISSLSEIKVDRMREGVIQNTENLILVSKSVVFHTGSYMIKAPTDEYNSLMSYITEKYLCYELDKETFCLCGDDTWFYDLDLGGFPLLRFYINNTEFELEPEYYIESSAGVCRIMLSDLGEKDYIILGLPFLRRYYTYFDFEREEIGLARAIKSIQVIFSSGSYLALASFALVNILVVHYIYKTHKPADESYFSLA